MEKWREVYTEEELQCLQQLLLKNLCVLTEVCSHIHVPFFVYGGTLIGAVRHHALVPWDDDLDVAMLRADYETFLAEAEKYLPEDYVLQTPYNDPKTPYSYTKLRLRGTKYVERGYHKLKIEQGIYVDIYPIDDLPEDETCYLRLFRKYQRWAKLYAWRQCPYIGEETVSLRIAVKKIVKFCLSIALKALPQSYIIKKIDRIETMYRGTETKRKGNFSFPRPSNYFSSVLPLEEGDLHGIRVMLPHDWDAHLRRRYGDYMQLPPEDARLGHRPYLLDFGKYGRTCT